MRVIGYLQKIDNRNYQVNYFLTGNGYVLAHQLKI